MDEQDLRLKVSLPADYAGKGQGLGVGGPPSKSSSHWRC